MFSFVRRWLGKSDKDKNKNEKAETETVKKQYKRGDPISYQLDFEGADEIVVSAKDCGRPNVEAVVQHFVRPEEIEIVVDLLANLPTEGEETMEINLCTEHKLTAIKERIPFAEVMFYEGRLKLENGKFIESSEHDLAMQAKLYDYIKIDVEK